MTISEVITKIKTYIEENFHHKLETKNFPIKDEPFKIEETWIHDRVSCKPKDDICYLHIKYSPWINNALDTKWEDFYHRANKWGQEIIDLFEDEVEETGYVLDREWGLDEDVNSEAYNLCLKFYPIIAVYPKEAHEKRAEYLKEVNKKIEIIENRLEEVRKYSFTHDPVCIFRIESRKIYAPDESPYAYDFYVYKRELDAEAPYYAVVKVNRDFISAREGYYIGEDGDTLEKTLNKEIKNIISDIPKEELLGVTLYLTEGEKLNKGRLIKLINRDIKEYPKKYLDN